MSNTKDAKELLIDLLAQLWFLEEVEAGDSFYFEVGEEMRELIPQVLTEEELQEVQNVLNTRYRKPDEDSE